MTFPYCEKDYVMHDERIALHQDDIALSRRLIPGLFAACLFLVFISFMIGYFLGVKHTTDEFATQIRQETIADQLLVSSVTAGASAPEPEQGSTVIVAENEQPAAAVVMSDVPAVASAPVASEPATVMRYGAELIGFGTKSAAQEFMNRVATYNPIPLALKERHSRTPRGRIITWYQVVTERYENKQELQKMLDTLIKKERLHDIKIVAYAPSAKDLT
jgi:hypothetical protein